MIDNEQGVMNDKLVVLRAEIAKANERIRELEQSAEFLFDMLDDIDTVDDIYKGNDAGYRKRVRHYAKRRFEVGSVDENGQTVTIHGLQGKADERIIELETAINEYLGAVEHVLVFRFQHEPERTGLEASATAQNAPATQ